MHKITAPDFQPSFNPDTCTRFTSTHPTHADEVLLRTARGHWIVKDGNHYTWIPPDKAMHWLSLADTATEQAADKTGEPRDTKTNPLYGETYDLARLSSETPYHQAHVYAGTPEEL